MISHFSQVPLFVTHALWTARLLCPRDSPGKNTGVGHHALLQGNLPCPVSGSCFYPCPRTCSSNPSPDLVPWSCQTRLLAFCPQTVAAYLPCVFEFPVTDSLPEPILTWPPANLSFPFDLHFPAYHNQPLSPQWYQVPP